MAEDQRDLFGAGGPDAAPNPSHLREKTAEELLNELEMELGDMSEADYDQAWVDAYLDELDRREPPGGGTLRRNPRWSAFTPPTPAASHMARRQRGRAMKTAACLILVCGLSLGGLLAVSPGVRAWTKMYLSSGLRTISISHTPGSRPKESKRPIGGPPMCRMDLRPWIRRTRRSQLPMRTVTGSGLSSAAQRLPWPGTASVGPFLRLRFRGSRLC